MTPGFPSKFSLDQKLTLQFNDLESFPSKQGDQDIFRTEGLAFSFSESSGMIACHV